MESEQVAEIEKLKKENTKTKQILDELMDMMSTLLNERGVPESSSNRAKGVKEDREHEAVMIGYNPVNVAIPPQVNPTYYPTSAFPYTTSSIPMQAFGSATTFIPQPMSNAIPLFNPSNDAINPVVVDEEKKDSSMESSKLFSLLYERLKMIKGFSCHRAMNATEATMVPSLIISPKFKVPEFEKYSGSKCPQEHLLSYVHKMAAYADDDKLMIHFFQDSLTVAASRWYHQ